jgi:DNA-directed RNA polymerase subunit RPC12/RpoP
MDGDARIKPQKEIGRVRGGIKKLEKEKEHMFPGLGSATYQVFLAGKIDNPALLEHCRAIQAIDTKIQEAQAKINELQVLAQQQAAMGAQVTPSAVCPQCGSAVIAGMRFCGNCGQVMPQAPSGAACPSCGSLVAPGTKFCGECGAIIQSAPSQPAPVPPSPPSQSAASPAPPPPAPEAPAEEPAGGKCPKCGGVVEEQDAAFCGACGARIAP